MVETFDERGLLSISTRLWPVVRRIVVVAFSQWSGSIRLWQAPTGRNIPAQAEQSLRGLGHEH